MIIVGADLSMNGSGLVKLYLDDDLKVYKTDRMGFCSVKKYESDGIYLYRKKDFKHRYNATKWMLEKIKDFVSPANYIAIEDYAFGASGNNFDIGEFIGQIKYMVFANDIPMRLYDPNSIKKFATGKGNADKISMYDSFINVNDIKPDIKGLPIPNKGSGVTPTSDIIDAYWIAMLLRQELSLRKGIDILRDLDENLISIFNRVTKSNPVNILDQDFIN